MSVISLKIARLKLQLTIIKHSLRIFLSKSLNFCYLIKLFQLSICKFCTSHIPLNYQIINIHSNENTITTVLTTFITSY